MELKGKRIIILIENTYNDREFWYPYYRLKEAGAVVVIGGPEQGVTYNGASGIPAESDVAVSTVRATDLDGLIIPGGYAPDRMRRHAAMVQLVKDMDKAGKVVAAICHAGWMLASADILRNRTATSFFAIKDDMINAGANYVDREVAVDGKLITSRTPDDLPAFMKAVIAGLSA